MHWEDGQCFAARREFDSRGSDTSCCPGAMILEIVSRSRARSLLLGARRLEKSDVIIADSLGRMTRRRQQFSFLPSASIRDLGPLRAASPKPLSKCQIYQ